MRSEAEVYSSKPTKDTSTLVSRIEIMSKNSSPSRWTPKLSGSFNLTKNIVKKNLFSPKNAEIRTGPGPLGKNIGIKRNYQRRYKFVKRYTHVDFMSGLMSPAHSFLLNCSAARSANQCSCMSWCSEFPVLEL